MIPWWLVLVVLPYFLWRVWLWGGKEHPRLEPKPAPPPEPEVYRDGRGNIIGCLYCDNPAMRESLYCPNHVDSGT